MSQSCLVVAPSSGKVVMDRKSEMGIKSRDPMNAVDAIVEEDCSQRISSRQPGSTGDKQQTTLNNQKSAQEVVTYNILDPRPVDIPDTSRNDTASEGFAGSNRGRQDVKEGDSSDLPAEEDTKDSGPSSVPAPSIPQHERVEPPQPQDISYFSTPASLRLRQILIGRLEAAVHTGRIQVIDLSHRGLASTDAPLIRSALASNPQLAVLKLGYNNLGDRGATTIASNSSKDGRHHNNLMVLDLGFNGIGDKGCKEIALKMVAGNHTLRKLYLSGNVITEKGAAAISSAIIHGCGLSHLHLSANSLGPNGIKVISGAVAEMDARRQQLLKRQGGIVVAAVKPLAIDTLLLGGTSITSNGIISLSGMVVANQSLRVLELCNNGIDDRDMAMISQALAQNKLIPLHSIYLSFNKITCVGVECFMNAIWGSITLKEIKLDNNKMQDRGAQLCSVVLGSIALEVLDISFNRISTIGIKAVMKSLSENNSLNALSLSGIPMDQNASKAISYALAYNQSLLEFHIDSCCVGYSGQRHIVAGIVSNTAVKLRVVTGFQLSAITKTLGLPQIPDDWGNDRVLSFIRFMWSHWHEGNESRPISRGPAAPATVASSGKQAFAALSTSDTCKLQFQSEHSMAHVDESPVITPDASILVRSDSGKNLQIPLWGDSLEDEDSWSDADSFDRSSFSGSSHSITRGGGSVIDPERRNRNLQWARVHFQALNEIGNLAFNNADLWQLHQYYFSPVYTMTVDGSTGSNATVPNEVPVDQISSETLGASGSVFSSSPAKVHQDRLVGTSVGYEKDSGRPNKRSSDEEIGATDGPSAKRAKSSKPRIAFFPRIREKLESLGAKPSVQTLSLLRQLKYIESVMLKDKNVYDDESSPSDGKELNAEDVEMVLLDLF